MAAKENKIQYINFSDELKDSVRSYIDNYNKQSLDSALEAIKHVHYSDIIIKSTHYS